MSDESDAPAFSIQWDSDDAARPYIHRDGKATATFPNNDTYIGQYVNKQRNGQGIYAFTSLNETTNYTGGYRDGQRHGAGRLVYPDGSVYEGQWEAGQRSGEGVYLYPNGDQYIGQWANDRRHGHGRYIYASDRTEFSGQWANGQCSNGQWEAYSGKLYTAKIHHGKVVGYV